MKGLSAFNGLNPVGTWKLLITDTAFEDVGVLNSFELIFNGAGIVDEPSTFSNASGNYVLSGLSAATHNIRRITPAGLVNLEPTGDVQSVALAANATVQNKNFGHITPVTATPAKITNVKIDDGGVQRSLIRSLQITFDQKMDASVSTAFSLTRNGGGAVTFIPNVDNSGPTTVVTLNGFTGSEAEFTSLVDGRYTLTIDASKATTGGGAAKLDGNGDSIGGDNFVLNSTGTTGVFRLFGDGSGDAVVTSTDFAMFRTVFGVAGPTFDFDNNGVVNSNDFAEFRKRFGIALP
jgi:hypothetical protein